MPSKEDIQKRFEALASPHVRLIPNGDSTYTVDLETWGRWSSSALNLIQIVFGEDSTHYKQLYRIVNEDLIRKSNYEHAKGIFAGAKADYEQGFATSLEKLVSGEVFGDFLAAAKKALAEGNKDTAAVLACIALEDALKRYARANGLNTDNNVTMTEVINALKGKGLVAGAQKGILENIPKTRNNAMHADWSKISEVEVGGVIGFTEQFLLQHFS